LRLIFKNHQSRDEDVAPPPVTAATVEHSDQAQPSLRDWIEYGTAHPALKSRAKLNRRSATEKIEGFYV